MLYEIVWLVFALMITIILSIGLLGLFLSSSIPGLKLRPLPIIISVLIILTAIYFSFHWTIDKRKIQTWSQEAEQVIKKYLETHKK
jgi:phosphotransferase system  glucose/maltose/N-acetylglucosamine-specific IIC component